MSSSSPSCKLYNYNMLRPRSRLIQTFPKRPRTQAFQGFPYKNKLCQILTYTITHYLSFLANLRNNILKRQSLT